MIRRAVLAGALAVALAGCGTAEPAGAPAERELRELEKIVGEAERAADQGELDP